MDAAATYSSPKSTATRSSVTNTVAPWARIDLPAGDYWVSLTPKHSLGIFPYTVHLTTTGPVVGDPTPTVVACTANTNWVYNLAPSQPDYAIKIEGDAVVPTLRSSWSKVKSIYR